MKHEYSLYLCLCVREREKVRERKRESLRFAMFTVHLRRSKLSRGNAIETEEVRMRQEKKVKIVPGLGFFATRRCTNNPSKAHIPRFGIHIID